jgi:hypothetical protein
MTVLTRVDTERISNRARQANPAKVVVTILALILFAPGWLLARGLGYGWFVAMWIAAAFAEGFTEGFRDTPWSKAIAVKKAARRASRAAGG